MRDYSKVGPQFWIGKTGKALRRAGAEAQIVGMYLMSSPHANMTGLYYVSRDSIAHETGLGMEGASKGLQSCIDAGYCSYDDDSEMVWVREMAFYQIAEKLTSTDKRSAGVQNEYDALPDNPFLGLFFEKYSVPFNMTRNRGTLTSPIQAPSEPLGSQEQAQEHEQAQEQAQADGETARAITAVDLSIAMRKAGMQTQPADPRLIALAAQGIDPETVTAACEEAKRTKPNQRIGAGYIFAILERWALDAAALKVAGASAPKSNGVAWWASEATITAKGAEFGLTPLPGEFMPAFKGRIQATIDNGGKPPVQAMSRISSPVPIEPKGVKPAGLDLKALVGRSAPGAA